MKRICIYPKAQGMGGVGSFRIKFAQGLKARGIEISYDLDDPHVALILVLAGTKNLGGLWRARQRGVPIIQRLDGINWVHRKRWTGVRHFLRAEYGNRVLSLIRSRLVDGIIYQSQFSKDWWEEVYGNLPLPSAIAHNGVDLEIFSPASSTIEENATYNILTIEGNFGGGYDMGLVNAIRLAELLMTEYDLPVQLTVVGQVPKEQKERWNERTSVPIQWAGRVPRDEIPNFDRVAHLFFSADLNPACPNAVIEAMACGTPVIAFDTGSLAELVPPSAGRVVPYGGDVWKLEEPDMPALAKAAQEILADQLEFSSGARKHAEENLGLEMMVDQYLDFMEEFL